MSQSQNKDVSAFSRFKTERKAVRLSQKDLVRTRYLNEVQLPLVYEPDEENVNLISWAASQREPITAQLLRHGALLFRGFGLDTVEQFQELTHSLTPELLDYRERAAPRLEVAKSIYTSTEFPADQSIPMHHEMSYSHNWPSKLYFYCVQPAQARGCTPLTDDRKVIQRLDPRIQRTFLERGVMYVRNYGEGVDLPWKEAFQAETRAEVEAYCRASYMEVEWRGETRLRTRARRQVTVTHPVTGDTVWFNHAHMFHVSSLPAAVRDSLLSEFQEDELPRNAFYGDGGSIESSVLDEIRGVYDECAVTFPWQKGDVLLVDNVLCSHGREPFEGPRKILVAMSELYTNPAL